MIVTTLAGQSLTLEDEAFNNTGSEGRLYNIKGKPDYVAKIFRTAELARKREQKLKAMSRLPAMCSLPPNLTWPVNLLYDDGGAFVGFIMKRLQKSMTLDKLFATNGTAMINQRLAALSSLANTLGRMHMCGVAMGDPGPQNIPVLADCTVQLIDTDSFAINMPDGSQFPCLGCTPEYVAPEMLRAAQGKATQNRAFRSANGRTATRLRCSFIKHCSAARTPRLMRLRRARPRARIFPRLQSASGMVGWRHLFRVQVCAHPQACPRWTTSRPTCNRHSAVRSLRASKTRAGARRHLNGKSCCVGTLQSLWNARMIRAMPTGKALRPARIARRRSVVARWRTRCALRWACRLCRARSARGAERNGLPRRCGELRTRTAAGGAAARAATGPAGRAGERAAGKPAARAVASQRVGVRPAPGLPGPRMLGTRMPFRSLRATWERAQLAALACRRPAAMRAVQPPA